METMVSSLVIGVIGLACLYVMYKCKDDNNDYEDIINDLQESNHKQLELINQLNFENKELHNSNQQLRKELLDYIIMVKNLKVMNHEHTNIS